jgi:hypothetical protein
LELVYVIGDIDPPYKIGRTTDITHRLTAIQIAHHRPLYVRARVETDNSRSVEREMHAKLAAYRLTGEWFDCSLATIAEAFRAVGVEPLLRSTATRHEPSGAAFERWLEAMRQPPYLASEDECARLLGVSANSVVRMKQDGADLRTALACRALFHRLEPWS